jgi:hypothetical protein
MIADTTVLRGYGVCNTVYVSMRYARTELRIP